MLQELLNLIFIVWHNSRIPYAPYSFRVRMRIKIRVRVRDWGYGLGLLGIRIRVRVVAWGIIELFSLVNNKSS